MYDAIADELLKFIDNPLEADEEAKHAYQLMRTRIFLEMKFGHVPGLQKEVEALRQWQKTMMPIVTQWSERQDLAQRHPFSHLEEEG